MAPIPQGEVIGEVEVSKAYENLLPNEIVISGMSGTFANCHNVNDLLEKLYSKEDITSNANTRWAYQHPEAPKYLGIAPDLDNFDAQFFKVHRKQGITMDAMSRKLLEHAYQAVYDAGVASVVLRNKKVGVFVGTAISDYEKVCFYVPLHINAFGIAGCNRSMFANRISYWLDAKGPSFSIDAACSSSMVALERAYDCMKRGVCEAAIVGGANLCFHPHVSVHYRRLGVLSDDGKTRSFDKNASGAVRADAVNCLFLQKAMDAKRVYAKIKHIKSQCNTDPDTSSTEHHYGPERPVKCLVNFWNEFYRQSNISPLQVEYVEAYGSAIPKADKAELEAIDQVFCKGKDKTLAVGSVMSNIGHTEASSGISAVTKVLLAYHSGQVAANLNYETAREDVGAIREGRIRVLDEHEPFDRTYVAVNSHSLGGLNCHALLYGNYKKKDLEKYKSDIPRLVTVSGRVESAVQKIIDYLKCRPIDAEQISLFHNIHRHDIQGHLARGYTILATNDAGETVSLSENCAYYPDVKRPVWFVYSGMGSQWPAMGQQLMRIPIFAAAIEKCHKILEPKGIDLLRILVDPDKTIYDNILNSFVGIAAVQIGLTDILRQLGIVPDNIIGHSVGELGCAYADGCFTAEEMILAAYSRGLVSIQTPFIKGAMAAVGLGYKDIISLCPSQIEVACHNASNSSTISGPVEVMQTFVAELTAKGIFAKEVPCSNIAYHSRYIAEAGPALLNYLREVITDPKPRSKKWVSTSVPQDKWDEEEAKYSSAEYHTNNLLRSVLFEETATLIPNNAIVIEVAPHGLLQAILKRSLGENCVHVPLTRRGHSDPVTFFLENIGKLYQAGLTPQVHVLYPKIEFPVSTETPMLSHLVEWMHSESWPLPKYAEANCRKANRRLNLISIHDEEHKYITGHVKNGRILYPEAGMLVLVWETLAMLEGKKMDQLSVKFQNIRFDSDVTVTHDEILILDVTIQKGTGRFEITYEGNSIASGCIRALGKNDLENFIHTKVTKIFPSEESEYLTSPEIYKLFHTKGYHYGGSFRSIHKCNMDFTKGHVVWNDDWVTFIDSLLQLNYLRRQHDGISKIKYIRTLTVSINKHETETMVKGDEEFHLEAKLFKLEDLTRCGGVLLQDITYNDLPQPQGISMINRREFIPYHPVERFNEKAVIHIYLQLVAENSVKEHVNVIEFISKDNKETLGHLIKNSSNELMNITIDYKQIGYESANLDVDAIKKCSLMIGHNLLSDKKIKQALFKLMNKRKFLLSIEKDDVPVKNSTYVEVAAMKTSIGHLVLAKLRSVKESNEYISFVSAPQEVANFSFLEHTRNNLLPVQKLIIITEAPPPTGLTELVCKWNRASDRNNVNLIITDASTDSSCNINEQLAKNLVVSMYKNGQWGSEYYLPTNFTEMLSSQVILHSTVPGNISSLTWMDMPEIVSSNRVQIHYAGLTHYDIMKATGGIRCTNDQQFYGMDFSGVTANGQRVMGVVGCGALATALEPDLELLWPVPDHWTLEEAATVPLPYAHAFYLLAFKANLQSGSKILVHCGAGALGQAIIAIALAMGCEVFTTVSNVHKKRVLKSLYPELRDDHIGSSRDGSFEDLLLSQTKGLGCNIVVNYLSGQLREASMRCVAPHGILIDVSMADWCENGSFGMNYLNLNRHYYTANFSLIFQTENTEIKKMLRGMVSAGIAAGYVRPLSRVTLVGADAARAAHLLARASHCGRVLLTPEDISVQPRIALGCGSYAVVGTDHGLSLELVSRLIKRGARNILLHYTGEKGYMKMTLNTWSKMGINIMTTTANLREYHNAADFLQESAKLGPIEGIFIMDTTKDRTQENLSVENIDQVARKLAPALKFFVVLRPVEDEIETTSQRVCARRALDKLSALYLRMPTLTKFDESKVLYQTVNDALDVLETSLRLNYQDVVTYAQKDMPKHDLLQRVGNILGVDLKELPDETTLKTLGTDFEKTEEIRNFLKKCYKCSCSRQNVPEITIEGLKKVQRKLANRDKKEVKQLEVYFSNIDSDELTATAEIIVMQTLVYEPAIRSDEFESKKTYLVLIPGMEGHHGIFTRLCDRLKIFAMTMQPGLDNPRETVRQTAQRFVKKLDQMTELHAPFYILGYSYGVLIAIEMAALLEEKGLEGTVFCVDSAPDVFLSQLNLNIGRMPKEELQNTVIDHMYTVMVGQSSAELRNELVNVTSWEQKVALAWRHLRGRVHYSTQYALSYIETAYGRIQEAMKYDPVHLQKKPLQSKIVLMRCRHQPDALSAYPKDFGLSKYTRQPVVVHDLEEGHADALQDLRCTGIVHKHLDPRLLEEFSQKNLCETYLPNGVKFVDITDQITV